jgi:hypothetical protein
MIQKLVLVACVLAFICSLSSSCPAQEEIVDTGSGQWKADGTSIHTCPLGFGMEGADVGGNIFTCIRVAPDALVRAGRVERRLDKGTKHNYNGRGDMHVCPDGWYMSGLHNGKNWLVCSNGAPLEPPVLDADGATQGDPGGHKMHMCPIREGQKTVMTGIHDGRNDFACAKFR